MVPVTIDEKADLTQEEQDLNALNSSKIDNEIDSILNSIDEDLPF